MNDVLETALAYKSRYLVVGSAHYIAARRCTRFNRYLGIPVVIITAVVGTTIFATLEKNPSAAWKIATGIISMLGAVLSSLQTSLRFAESAERHKTAGARYRGMGRRIDLFLLKYAGENTCRIEALRELSQLADELQDLADESPGVPDSCYDKAKGLAQAKSLICEISGRRIGSTPISSSDAGSTTEPSSP
jgi:hypothetical protein